MTDLGYNEDEQNENKEWQSQDGQHTGDVVERIDTSELETLTTTGCEHKNVTRRPAEEFDADVIEVSCDDCIWGTFEHRVKPAA